MNEQPMRASNVVAILLRIFAIYWAVQGVLMLPGFFLTLPRTGMRSGDWMSIAGSIVYPVAYWLFAILAWIFGEAIAAKVAGRDDPKLPFLRIARADLFAFGMLVLGLYFFLAYLAASLNWLHYFAVIGKTGQQDGQNGMYELTSQLVPCIAGLLLAINSTRFGRKLAGIARDEAASEAEQI